MMQTLYVMVALFCFCACQASTTTSTNSSQILKKTFPSGFRFGVATSAFQIEGNWNTTGKSESIWDVFCHTPRKIRDNSTADDACKSYEFYQRDVEMLKYLGVDFYRISISWPRILPKGFSNVVNQAGIDYYNKLIDELLKNNIDPVVTMYHWDMPQCLQDYGGWTNPLVVQWMEDYARVLFDNFGDRVKTWITLNEPQFIVLGYNDKRFAPGVLTHGIGDYYTAKYMVLAHAHIWHMYDKEYRHKQQGVVGIANSVNFLQGLTDSEEDLVAAQDAFQFNEGLFAHPLFSTRGGFPPRVLELVAEKSKQQGFSRSRLIDFTEQEREYCMGAHDFYGFIHYTLRTVTRRTYKPYKYIPSMQDDLGANIVTSSENSKVTALGIRKSLKWVKDSYNNPKILILENGEKTDGDLQDQEKIDYLKNYLNNVLDAIHEDNVDVYGYTVWSLMDTFEWNAGYLYKFGLFQVDFEDAKRKRTARLSALWYRDLISSKTLNLDYVPAFEQVEY